MTSTTAPHYHAASFFCLCSILAKKQTLIIFDSYTMNHSINQGLVGSKWKNCYVSYHCMSLHRLTCLLHDPIIEKHLNLCVMISRFLKGTKLPKVKCSSVLRWFQAFVCHSCESLDSSRSGTWKWTWHGIGFGIVSWECSQIERRCYLDEM